MTRTRKQKKDEAATTQRPAYPWWWEFHWDCLIYGSPLAMQESLRAKP
jgi:hypothetical protein